MAVQYSIQKMVSDGTLSTIALGIQYLQRNDIYIRIAGEETPHSGAPSGYTWSFLDNTTLKILPAVPNGVEVVVYRRTDVDAMYNIYSQNAQFDEATIDENNQQLLYIAQEYLEQGLPGAGVDTIEYVRDDGSFTYYRMRRTDGSYSEEFTVPSASSSTKVLTRESLRRSYAEAGYTLVAGSFEAGGTVTTATDILLYEADGIAYSWGGTLPKTVPAGSTPSSSGGISASVWVDRSLSPNSFKQNGTGAVILSAQEKMREMVSVTDYGAKGDGVTDDTAAFNAASAVSPNGVYVPQGTYLIPTDIAGKYFGPGRRITSVGFAPIPFANPAQSHGTVFVGYDAGKTFSGNPITGQVVGVGPGACRNVTTGTNITAVGAGTLTGDTLVDAITDTSPCTGIELIAIGVNALKKAVTLDNTIGIGRDALNENKFGSFNIGIGSSALQQLHTGSGNVAVGRSAGMRAGMITNPSGVRIGFNVVNGCTFVGNGAGREITSGDSNTYIGNSAGRGVTSGTNSFTGTATGGSNVAVGAEALNEIGTASHNVMVGFRAGRTLSSGNGNIFLGYSAGAGVTGGDNKLIIANQGSLPYLEGLMGPVADANNYARFDASVQPASDNLRACGSSSRRWSVIFAGNGTINTSDGREKTAPLPIDDAALDAWGDVQLITFQWLEAIRQKGKDASRWHFGVVAQQVRDAFCAHGLDGTRYGLLCYDEWDDEFQPVMGQRENPETGELEEYPTGEQEILIAAGNRWGIRADQCLFLEAAYQRRERERDRKAFSLFKESIEARLIALEGK